MLFNYSPLKGKMVQLTLTTNAWAGLASTCRRVGVGVGVGVGVVVVFVVVVVVVVVVSVVVVIVYTWFANGVNSYVNSPLRLIFL